MKNWDEITISRVLVVFFITTCLVTLLSGCLVYGGSYGGTSYHGEDELDYFNVNYAPIAGLYYYNDSPYWGYHSGYYYYYGYRHIYPWWYYYNHTPSYYYNITTHVHCHLGNSGYVYRPRGNWRHNNKTNLTYNHNNVHTTGVKVISNSNVPTKGRGNVRVKTNRTKVTFTPNRTTIRNIDNKIIPIRVKTNSNRSNNTKVIKTNTRTNVKKTNTNRINKTNTRNKSNQRPR